MEYDEQAAIAYIRGCMSEEARQRISGDEILNVIDMIFDYYDESGLLDIDIDEDSDDELDVDALIAYVKKMVAKDKKSPLNSEDVDVIVRAELEFESSIDE